MGKRASKSSRVTLTCLPIIVAAFRTEGRRRMNKRLLSLLLAWTVVHPLFADSFTTNIVDGFATNITTEFILGDTGPYNFLLITNAGRMTNHERVFIGNTVDAFNNTAIVTGTGSGWHLDDQGYLGVRSPSNRMAILDGARFRAR